MRRKSERDATNFCQIVFRNSVDASRNIGIEMSKILFFNISHGFKRDCFTRMMLVALTALAMGMAGTAMAEQGCEDMRQLCKDATAEAAKCAKQGKPDAPPNCKPLTDVRETTCAQAEIICKPASGEQKP